MKRRGDHVVLFNLPSPWLISDRDIPPNGILALAASLRAHGISVEICDLAGKAEGDWSIPAGDVYGIGFTTPQYALAKRLADWLAQDQACKIVLGGPHCSALPVRTFREMQSDVVLAGEADWSLADYVLGRPVEEIPGATWLDGRGEAHVNPLPVVPVHMLPLPARDLVDIDAYHRIETFGYVGGTREGYVNAGRGCPYDCAFCGQRSVTGGVVRWRTAEQVSDEVRLLKHRYGCDQVEFLDDTLNVDPTRMRALCDVMAEAGVVWHCLCRADKFDAASAERMRAAGCRSVTFGFESGSDEILRRMGKGFTVAQSLRAAEVADAAGLMVRAQMIVGFPGETDDTVTETLEFAWRAAVAKWGFHIFAPLPGSRVWRDPAAFGLEIDKEAVDFSRGFTTIGRPDEWDETHVQARGWLELLIAATKGRNTYEGVAT